MFGQRLICTKMGSLTVATYRAGSIAPLRATSRSECISLTTLLTRAIRITVGTRAQSPAFNPLGNLPTERRRQPEFRMPSLPKLLLHERLHQHLGHPIRRAPHRRSGQLLTHRIRD